MEVIVEQDTPWVRALNAARRTIGKEPKDKDYVPSEKWRKSVLMAEHSPIKLVEYLISFKDLKQWIGVHLLRHPYTIPMIHSQRSDRRDIKEEYPYVEKVAQIIKSDILSDHSFNPRDYVVQGEVNDQDFYVNAQTLINISRKRLCSCSSKETREAWQAVKDAVAEIDPVMSEFMVRQCCYRGFCPELSCCGYCKTEKFKKELNDYRNLIGRGEMTES